MGTLLSTPVQTVTNVTSIQDEHLPEWFLLKNFPGLEIDIEHWLEFAEKRTELFLRENVDHQTPNITEQVTQEIAGHLLLRLAASKNPRLASWLVEKEGDLFAFRYRNATIDQKLIIAKRLLKPYNIRKVEDLEPIIGKKVIEQFELNRQKQFKRKKKVRGKSRTGKPTIRTITEPTPLRDATQVGFHFSCVPDIISERKTFLYRGWAIAPMFVFHLSVKRAYETQLRILIQESVEKLNLDKRVANLADRLAKQMETIVHTPEQLELDGEFSGSTIYKRYDLFPLCSRDLIAKLRSKGHLSHNANLQLGFFLKTLGMPMDEQMLFWYENSVDNVGRTFEQFERKVGYLIRHIYGQVGRKIDYKAPKCRTIMQRYHCPFMHRSSEDIEVLIRDLIGEEPLINNKESLSKIKELVTTRRASSACSLVFLLKFGQELGIWHPVQYVREAISSQDNHPKVIEHDESSIKNKPPQETSTDEIPKEK